MRTRDFQVAVIGAGIAGLTAATALNRVGFDCQVYEQAPSLREVGAGIQLAPNAVRPLRRLGLGAGLAATGVRPAAIQMRRWDDGGEIMSTPLGERSERLFGAPYYVLRRSDLHSALLALLPPERVHLGMRCVSLSEHSDGVDLCFDDNRRVTVDLVVGADGIHSVVRGHLGRDEPRFSGQTIYRGLVPAEAVPFLLAEPRVQLWLGPGRHCVAYPVANGTMVSFGATAPAEGWIAESWSAQGDPDELRAGYRAWCPEVRGLLGAVESVSRWGLYDRDNVVPWSGRRSVLVGDAAHPMLPFFAQGANQAVEDAVVLARCLRDLLPGHGMGAALRRYEALRRPRAEVVHHRSRANTRMLHLPDGRPQRDRDEKLANDSGPEGQRWLWGYDAEAAIPDEHQRGVVAGKELS